MLDGRNILYHHFYSKNKLKQYYFAITIFTSANV